MAIADAKPRGATAESGGEGKVRGLCQMPFFGGEAAGSSSSSNASSTRGLTQNLSHRSSGLIPQADDGGRFSGGRRNSGGSSVTAVARSLLPTRRRLRLDPPTKL